MSRTSEQQPFAGEIKTSKRHGLGNGEMLKVDYSQLHLRDGCVE